MSIPEGATHVVADIHGLSDSGKLMNDRYPYRKKDSAGWSAYVEGKWVGVVFGDPSRYQRIDKPWSGPEDGLPPLNTVCQMMDDAGCWIDVLIIANYDGYAHGWTSAEKDCFYSNEPNEFRPVQTNADKRETAIREIMDIAQVDCRVTAARLVDAGFKWGVV